MPVSVIASPNTLTPNPNTQIRNNQEITRPKEQSDNSAVLYASLAALAAAGIAAGGILLSRGRKVSFDSLLSKKNLTIEKGTGLLKDAQGKAFSGVLEYKTEGGKYVRKYKDGELVLSGKNIDAEGKAINDKVDFYKIEYVRENGRLREISSDKRTKGFSEYNSKQILTRKEKIQILEKDIEYLKNNIADFVERAPRILEKKETLNSYAKDLQERVEKLVKRPIGEIKPENLDLNEEQIKEFKLLCLEMEKVVNDIKAYEAEYNSLLKQKKNLQNQLSEKLAELKKLINK